MELDLSNLWAIKPDSYSEALQLLAGFNSRQRESPPSYKDNALYKKGIAFMPLHGVITQDQTFQGYAIGLNDFNAELKAIAKDKSIKTVFIHGNTGGGIVSPSLSETVKLLRQLMRSKRVAIFSDMLASAGVWIGSNATYRYGNELGMYGSVGVISGPYIDDSKALENEGVSVFYAATGEMKAVGRYGQGLTDTQKDKLNQGTREYLDIFVSDLSTALNLSTDEVLKRFGDADVFGGKSAKRLGLIDSLTTLEGALQAELKLLEGIPMTIEELRADHPALVAEIEQAAAAKAVADAAVQFEKKLKEASNNDTNAVLESKITELSKRLEAVQLESQQEKRLNIAMTALNAENFTYPTVEGIDLKLSFENRVKKAALQAATDEEAQSAVSALIAEQKAVQSVTVTKHPQGQHRVAIPHPAQGKMSNPDTREGIKELVN